MMDKQQIEIREFFPAEATEAAFEALLTFENKMRAERQPGIRQGRWPR